MGGGSSLDWGSKRIVAKAQATGVLALEGRGLTKFPEEICSQPAMCQHLLNLNLEANAIQEIPYSINKLTALQRLSLTNNRLGKLPLQMVSLSHLETLNLGYNKFGPNLPEALTLLSSLSTLNLNHNVIQSLSSDQGQAVLPSLRNLTDLDLAFNMIKTLPAEVTHLTKLKYLNLNCCGIQELPGAWKKQLPALEVLDLRQNQLISLPPFLYHPKLRKLRLTNNMKLQELPRELVRMMGTLITVDISYCPMRNMPPDFNKWSTNDIMAYLASRLDAREVVNGMMPTTPRPGAKASQSPPLNMRAPSSLAPLSTVSHSAAFSLPTITASFIPDAPDAAPRMGVSDSVLKVPPLALGRLPVSANLPPAGTPPDSEDRMANTPTGRSEETEEDVLAHLKNRQPTPPRERVGRRPRTASMSSAGSTSSSKRRRSGRESRPRDEWDPVLESVLEADERSNAGGRSERRDRSLNNSKAEKATAAGSGRGLNSSATERATGPSTKSMSKKPSNKDLNKSPHKATNGVEHGSDPRHAQRDPRDGKASTKGSTHPDNDEYSYGYEYYSSDLESDDVPRSRSVPRAGNGKGSRAASERRAGKAGAAKRSLSPVPPLAIPRAGAGTSEKLRAEPVRKRERTPGEDSPTKTDVSGWTDGQAADASFTGGEDERLPRRRPVPQERPHPARPATESVGVWQNGVLTPEKKTQQQARVVKEPESPVRRPQIVTAAWYPDRKQMSDVGIPLITDAPSMLPVPSPPSPLSPSFPSPTRGTGTPPHPPHNPHSLSLRPPHTPASVGGDPSLRGGVANERTFAGSGEVGEVYYRVPPPGSRSTGSSSSRGSGRSDPMAPSRRSATPAAVSPGGAGGPGGGPTGSWHVSSPGSGGPGAGGDGMLGHHTGGEVPRLMPQRAWEASGAGPPRF